MGNKGILHKRQKCHYMEENLIIFVFCIILANFEGQIHNFCHFNILKAKSNFTLFIFEYIYTRSDFKQMEYCH